MPDAIQFINGEAQMAYALDGGVPWHTFGEPFPSTFSMEDVRERLPLLLAPVTRQPIYVLDDRTGLYVQVPERISITRINPETDELEPIEVFTDRYTEIQNERVVCIALDMVKALPNDPVIETIGGLDDGHKMFISIRMARVIIDEFGIADGIDPYLLLWSSHDGTIPLSGARTGIRPVCKNTCHLAMERASYKFSIRHTPNAEDRIAQQTAIMHSQISWQEQFKKKMEALVEVPMSHARLNTVLHKMFPIEDKETDLVRTRREAKVVKIHDLFDSDTNAPRVGENGYAAYGAIAEYFDHWSAKDADTRARRSMDLDSFVNRAKSEAADLILTLN